MISKETFRGGFPIRELGDVAEFLDSQRRPITASDRVPGVYPYYGANGQQDSVADYIFDEPLILLAEDGGLFDQPDRGIAYAIKGKTWVNNHAHVLRARDDVQQEYLVRVLENYDVTPWITGSTRAKLTKAGASRIQIPLPPLAEQKRIAAILDAADALRAKRRESLAQIDALLQSTFLDMFGDPVTNPMGFPKETLTSAFAFTTGKLDSNAAVEGGKYPFFTCARETFAIDDYKFDCEALLLAGNNANADYSVKHYKGKFNAYQRTYVITVDESQLRYAYARLALEYLLGDLKRFSKGTNTKYLTMAILNRMPILVPPLERQHDFAAIVESIEQQKINQRVHLGELDALFASLQSRAFRGDL